MAITQICHLFFATHGFDLASSTLISSHGRKTQRLDGGSESIHIHHTVVKPKLASRGPGSRAPYPLPARHRGLFRCALHAAQCMPSMPILTFSWLVSLLYLYNMSISALGKGFLINNTQAVVSMESGRSNTLVYRMLSNYHEDLEIDNC